MISLDAKTTEESYLRDIPVSLTPELTYERRWALALLDRVLAAMREDYGLRGKGGHDVGFAGFPMGGR